MSDKQYTVLGLLILLAGLEIVRSPNVRGFFTSMWQNFNAALAAGSNVVGVNTAPVQVPSGYPTTTPTNAHLKR